MVSKLKVEGLIAEWRVAEEDFASTVAIQDRTDVIAFHRDAFDPGHGGGRDADLGELFLGLLVQVHRLAGAGIDRQGIADFMATVIEGFDFDRLRLGLLGQIRVKVGPRVSGGDISELDITFAAIHGAFGSRDIAERKRRWGKRAQSDGGQCESPDHSSDPFGPTTLLPSHVYPSL